MILLETLLSVGVGLFAAAGVGAWLPIRSIAGRVLAGLLLIPLSLIVLNILLPLALSKLALLIFAVSAVGWVKLVRAGSKEDLPLIFTNPVFVLPVLFVAGLMVVGDVGYQSFEWDEFASWLNWAKELYLFDSLTAEGMNWRNLGYPQAWPMAIAIPQLIFSEFEPMRSLAVGVLWQAAVFGLVYELMTGYLAKKNWASPLIIALAGYFVIFLLLAGETLRQIVPQDFLIELPQIFTLAGAFALLGLAGIGEEKLRGASLATGIILAVGSMIKISVLAALPGAALVIFYLSINRETGGSGWKNAFINLGLHILPILIVQVIWLHFAGKFATSLSTYSFEFGLTAEHAALLIRLVEAAWIYIASWKSPITLLALAGLTYGATNKDFRPIVFGLLIYFILYGIGLFQLYAFRFGPYDVAELGSLQRYMRVPLRLAHILGLTVLALSMAVGTAGTRFDIRRYLSKNSFVAVGAIAVLLVGGFQIYAIRYGLTDVRDRRSLSQDRLAVIKDLQNDRQALLAIISDLGIKTPLVVLVAQGDDGFSARVVSFLALSDRRANKQDLYRTFGEYSWGEQPENQWMRKTTASDFVKMMQNVDIIWVHRRDPWINDVLNRMGTDCNRGIKLRFLVKRRSGDGFRCAS